MFVTTRKLTLVAASHLIVAAFLVASCGSNNPASPGAAAAPSNEAYVISGVVVDAVTSQPIEGAMVVWGGELKDFGGPGEGALELTDQNGRYQMRFTSSGAPDKFSKRATIRATKEGYAADSRLLTVALPSQTTANFALARP